MFFGLTMLLSCSDNAQMTADAGACMCKAAQVSFDKASSTLGATNVQDALDELAARPIAEPPIATRIKIVDKGVPNPKTSGNVEATADCPNPGHDMAIGGGCGFVDSASINEAVLVNDATHASYRCGWSQPTGSSTLMSVSVVCLLNAR
jgi:hypothetical protein